MQITDYIDLTADELTELETGPHGRHETGADEAIDPIRAWAEGSPGPCPICGAAVLEGADCPERHFNEAEALATQAGMSLAKAVSIIKARP